MTLVELMVTTAVLALVALAASQVSIGFQQQYAAENLKRQAADSARTALVWIERDLRLAGYGMDPSLAFDFNIWRKTDGTGVNWCPTPGGNANQAGCLRDSITGPDELVFYSRDPFYWGSDLQGAPVGKAWSVLTGTATDLTLAAVGPNERFARNQILQLVCPGASQVVYVTVRDTTLANATVLNTMPVDNGDPFRQAPTSLGCINNGGARAFQVNRYRYAVENMLLGDNTTTVPTLVLDTGTDRNLDNAVNMRDLVKVATGVMDLQVAYVRVNPPPGGSPTNTPGTLARVGGTSGTVITNCTNTTWPITAWTTCNTGMIVQNFVNRATLYQGANGFGFAEYPLLDEPRQSPTYASIAEIQLAVVARSIPLLRDVQGRAIRTQLSNVLPASFNRPAGPTPIQFEMHVADTAVPIRNTRTRALSYY